MRIFTRPFPRRTRVRRPLRLWLWSPTVQRLAVLTLVVATLLSLHSQGAALDARAARLGASTDVAVAITDLAAGTLVTGSDVEVRQVPASMAPSSALAEVPVGRRLRVDVDADEILVARRLTDDPASALAAKVPTDWRAIAVPLPAGAIDLSPGDLVDLLAVGADGGSDQLVDSAIVVDTSDSSATVAVPLADTGDVADAVLGATLTVTLRGAS